MMELEEPERRGMIECQPEDIIRRMATSTEYTPQALRPMQPPRPHHYNIFCTHSDNNIHNFKDAHY